MLLKDYFKMYAGTIIKEGSKEVYIGFNSVNGRIKVKDIKRWGLI